jgi:hypothetical protein
MPFGVHCVAPGALTASPHLPSVAPAAFTQLPPQQSPAAAQTSFVCLQKETPTQSPALQFFEQHSPLPPQGLPVVLHVVERGAQMPPPFPSGEHVPPQHSSFFAHAWLSATHCFAEQVPPMHEEVQHSRLFAHCAPGALHVPTGGVAEHLLPTQFVVQHSALDVHAPSAGLQSGASERWESRIASMNELSSPVDPSAPASSPLPGGMSSFSLPHAVKRVAVPSAASASTT